MFALKNMIYILILLVFISKTTAFITLPNLLDINITSLQQCSSKNYPVQVSNVAVKVQNGKIHVSGTLDTTTDLISPIMATVDMKRHELGIWIKVPCVDKAVGSCIYEDLCVNGIPKNTSCPKTFIDNNVPCRCPIPKGTYTIKPSIPLGDLKDYSSIYSGTYWAQMMVFHGKNTILSCYDVYFQVKTKTGKENYLDNRNMLYDDEPFVQLLIR